MIQTCATCRHWQHDTPDQSIGNCHRHAPRPNTSGSGPFAATWPIVDQDDGCGDWLPAARTTPADVVKTLEHALADTLHTGAQALVRTGLQPRDADVLLQRLLASHTTAHSTG